VVAAEVEGKNLRAVRLESGERLPADAFIANVDRLTFAPLLGRTCEVSPSLSYFTVHWGLRGRHGGLGHHTLLVPADFERGFEALYRHKRLPERPIVYLNDTSATDPTQKPDLFAVVTAPAEEPHLDWKHLELDYVETIRSEMRTFGIEMGPEKTAWERVQSPRTFRERDGNYRGTLYGPEESQRLWGGLFPLPNRDHELRNLAYCGGSVQPGAGLPMVTLSGCFAARSLS
jgi:phytoene dehydrogenase-like protein